VPPAFCGGPNATRQPWADQQSYLQHGLLLSVYAKLVKDHDTLWHMYTADRVKTAMQLQETDRQMVRRIMKTFVALERRVPI